MRKILTIAFISIFIFNINAQNQIGGYEYVDLGLPSGTKWATCNVGATKPYQLGNYYSWGHTFISDHYISYSCETTDKLISNISGIADYDVARSIWGEKWRIPTKKEMEELGKKCNWEWIEQNGQYGAKITGPNGNSIFLPAAGRKWSTSRSTSIEDYYSEVNKKAFYWSSSPVEGGTSDSWYLYFDKGNVKTYREKRGYGFTIRPVLK